MKLYTFPGAPSPMRVDLMLQYKNLQLDTEQVDMRAGAHMEDPFRAINPRCTLPALVLDNGECLSEVIAILLYLDSKFPEKTLFGASEEERAMVINWMHRIFVEGFMACAEALRNASPAMKDRAMPGPDDIPQIPALAERGIQRARRFLDTLNTHLSGREFMVGNKLSQADIDAFVIVKFAGWVKIKPTDQHGSLLAWRERVAQMLEPA